MKISLILKDKTIENFKLVRKYNFETQRAEYIWLDINNWSVFCKAFETENLR